MMGGMMGRFRAELAQELTQFRSEIVEEFRHQIGVQREDSQHKLDLVVEGQQMLAEKLEATRSELKADIGKIDQRVIAVAADLSAHRRDTEAHRKGWRVREKEGGE
jgi:hypothetical protein